MKIVYFTDSWKPTVDGVVTSIELFAKELRKLGHEVHIVCPKGPGIKEDRYTHPISAMYWLLYPGYRVARLAPFKVKHFLRWLKPDLVHIHTPATVGISGLWAARSLKIPLVATYHTFLPEYLRYFQGARIKWFAGGLTDIYTRVFYDRFLKIISPSCAIKRYLRNVGVKKPIEVLPTGIEQQKFKPGKRKKNKIPVILHVGRLCVEKNVDVLIRAIKRIVQFKPVKLVITSDGPHRAVLEELVNELDLNSYVTFTGIVSEKEKARLFRECDVFVSASLTETQGIVVLEAMASGCPVVVADALGFRDFIRHMENGILFRSDLEMAIGILKVLDDDNFRKKIIKNGLDTARRYTIKNCTKSLLQIYNATITPPEKKKFRFFRRKNGKNGNNNHTKSQN